MSAHQIFTAPESASETQLPASATDLRLVRVILCIHLAAILLFAVFTLSDSGYLRIPGILQLFFAERVFQFLLAMTLFACPLAMGIAAYQLKGRSRRFRIGIVLLDVVLSIFQMWVMLPLVQ